MNRDFEIRSVDRADIDNNGIWQEAIGRRIDALVLAEFGLAEEVVGLARCPDGSFAVGIGEPLRPFRKVYDGQDQSAASAAFIQTIEALARPTRTVERVDVEAIGDDEWDCVCRNHASAEGFHPCDEQGNAVEPTAADWPDPLYRCDRCGRIILDGDAIGPRDHAVKRGAWVVGVADFDAIRIEAN